MVPADDDTGEASSVLDGDSVVEVNSVTGLESAAIDTISNGPGCTSTK